MENEVNFLKKKYNLHATPEVASAAKRTEMRSGEKVPQNPVEQMQNYLNRFKEIIDRKNPDDRQMGLDALKHILYRKFIIKESDIPESYFETQRRLVREQGHGDVDLSVEQKHQLSEVAIADQESSLDTWIDYLSSRDATYPDWLKYYSFRNILGMGAYDKEKKQFGNRDRGTVKPFPDLNREALAYVLGAIEKKTKKESIDLEHLDPEQKQSFEKLLVSESFPKLYAWAIDKLTPASQEQLAITKGSWVKYYQGEDHMGLVKSLQGHGTGWCTAGESTAKTQLENGDFYVYYSEDAEGDLGIPRAAIRMQDGKIAEVRGIAEQQNLDSYIAPIVEEKMKEFPDGKSYEKKSADMKILTAVENKSKLGQKLSQQDLVFLYEINSSIQGFGYQKDPRIAEIRATRKTIEDAPIVFDCKPEQIATNATEINQETKAYIGALFPDIFQKNIEHIFTKFPEGKIQKYGVELGGLTKEKIEQELKTKNVYISDWAQQLMDSDEFSISKKAEHSDLVRLSVRDLGFENGATTDQIYKKAEEFGLELCPAETGPQLRLQLGDQAVGDYFNVAMKQIADRGGRPNVFNLNRNGGGGLRLDTGYAKPADQWHAGYRFVFHLRKKL